MLVAIDQGGAAFAALGTGLVAVRIGIRYFRTYRQIRMCPMTHDELEKLSTELRALKYGPRKKELSERLRSENDLAYPKRTALRLFGFAGACVALAIVLQFVL